MKIKTISVIILLLGVISLFSSFGGDENTDYPSGAPAGYTGSPGDGMDCHNCHGGVASNVAGWITSDVPTQGYTAGTTYTITVSVSGSGNKGFEVSPQNASGTLLGTLVAGSGSHLTGSGKYVTQSNQSSSNPKVWTFQWIAPPAGTGTVTFYGAFCVSKPVTKLSTLVVNESVSPLAVTVTAVPGTICVSQSSQLNVLPSGGSGAYTYVWTSNPSGFNSSVANPLVSPALTTKYYASVSDGVSTVTDSVQVTVHLNATAFAGHDTTYSLNVSQIPLNGAASNYASVLWTTSGDGTFDHTGILNTVYSPGTNDRISLTFDLTLTAQAASPCTSNASDVIHILLDPSSQTGEIGTPVRFILYPNPAHGTLNISFQGSETALADLTLFDPAGKIAIRQAKVKTGSGLVYAMEVSGLARGIYFLQVKTENSSSIQKVIIE